MIKVRIPAPLRALTGGLDVVNVQGTTVKEALSDLLVIVGKDIGTRIYKPDGSVNRFMNIYLNDEDIRFLQNLDSPVKDGDIISLLSAIAGG